MQTRPRNMQSRRPQPLRRASASGRTLPTSGNLPVRAAAGPANLIVIRDGRILELTEQQQRDLNMVLSAMGATGSEPSNRRRAPGRRGRIVPARQVRQPFRSRSSQVKF
ncbi:hypothetical protein ANCCAN_08400 [Ancylostoma caninum]|uniref:Uncharacterized protein n=1 Tax=Ancylostoma caninum TaxID=29170 RepID=A0A368GRC2_ANCCA|nr:hypothetical protein ANCCAN_08400 [Ancylostoma caninum]